MRDRLQWAEGRSGARRTASGGHPGSLGGASDRRERGGQTDDGERQLRWKTRSTPARSTETAPEGETVA
ncbi:hypothetical protein Trydic_g15234, partial [Trypoxylus dichotomus]